MKKKAYQSVFMVLLSSGCGQSIYVCVFASWEKEGERKRERERGREGEREGEGGAREKERKRERMEGYLTPLK